MNRNLPDNYAPTLCFRKAVGAHNHVMITSGGHSRCPASSAHQGLFLATTYPQAALVFRLLPGLQYEVCSAVLLPAGIVFCRRAKRTLLAKADHLDPVGRNALLNQGILDLVGAALAQSEVVFVRASLVAMPFNQHLERRMGRQERGVAGDGRLLVTANIGIVIAEENVF